jgi:1-acyl-sn-glycerol-3-phosphate acyltransferase
VAARLRVHLNRLLVAAVLLVALPQLSLLGLLGFKRTAMRASRVWVRVGLWLTGVRIERRGHLESRPGVTQVLVANHSSPLDIAAILATTPGVRFVAGADLFRFPLLASAMRALGTVAVDRRSGNRTHLRLTGPSARSDLALAVFPEGAIAPIGKRLDFRRGAFALAIEENADVVPVAIHASARRLPPRARLGVRPGVTVVEFLAPIPCAGLSIAERRAVCERAQRAVVGALGPGDGGTRADRRPTSTTVDP